jgi:methyltransferase-like protein
MAPSNLHAAVEAGLQSVSTNVIEMEQYMDFAHNRMFRQTLLCHRGVTLDRMPSPERVQGMQVASAARPENAEVDIHSTAQTTYRTPSAVLTTTERLVKAAMQRLGEVWPRAVSFDELLTSARARLAGWPHPN